MCASDLFSLCQTADVLLCMYVRLLVANVGAQEAKIQMLMGKLCQTYFCPVACCLMDDSASVCIPWRLVSCVSVNASVPSRFYVS
jgi:hypothetical protein